MEGTLVVAHGSRAQGTKETFETILRWTEIRLGGQKVHYAFMESCEPSLPTVIEDMIASGYKTINVVPYFLFRGIHLRQDVPKLLDDIMEKHPGITLNLGPMLGEDPRLADILADRIRQ